jgi:sulfate adenylyltransferase subunit 2
MHLLDNDFAKDRLGGVDLRQGSTAAKILAEGRLPPPSMDHLDELEAQSIYILREAFARLKNCCGRSARIPTS